MSEPLPSVRPEFFGKDKTVLFIGQVEDVNDPKQSGRVRVRCVGWHPKDKQGEGGVKTDELPWAHVAMPTTHAQQGRVGGKHGLLPGSWVVGLFLDGEEVQKPLVLNTFNFTAGSSETNNRARSQSQNGKDGESDKPFTKREVAPDLIPNSATQTGKEGKNVGGDPLDPSRDTVTNDAKGQCGDLKSQDSKQRTEEEYKREKQGNPESQKYEVTIGDGLCGTNKNAKEDTKKTLKENMPSKNSRFVYGDVVWNAFSGDYLDVNAIARFTALQLCNLLKQAAQAEKAERENKEKRKQKSAQIKSQPGRNPKKRQQADKQTTQESDAMHALFGTGFIDILCNLTLNAINQINNGDDGGDGTNANTNVEDWGQDCIAESFLNTMGTLTQNALDTADAQSSGGSGGDVGAIAGLLASVAGGLHWSLEQKYSTKTEVHNSAGDQSQDQLTKMLGCLDFRLYNTNIGKTAGSSGSTGNLPNFGFGGMNGTPDGSTTPVVCEDATDPGAKPGGGGAVVIPNTTPSCYQNMIRGFPGESIVIEPGSGYFFNNPLDAKKAFPVINIQGYTGTPVPVVDPESGELVAVTTNCGDWGDSNPPIMVNPGESEIGISTNDNNFDVRLDKVFIQNMGFNYCNVTIEVWDRDKEAPNGLVKATVVEGHVVDVEVINRGTGFRRLPELRVTDECEGRGVNLYPIMTVVPSNLIDEPETIDVIDCPPRNNTLRLA